MIDFCVALVVVGFFVLSEAYARGLDRLGH